MRRRMSPVNFEESIRTAREGSAKLMAMFKPCPACGRQQAGPIHRTSVRLWQGRADRAADNDGTDPLSGVTSDEAERHLAPSLHQRSRRLRFSQGRPFLPQGVSYLSAATARH